MADSIGGVEFAILDVDEQRLVPIRGVEEVQALNQGLALDELTLNHAHEFWLAHLWNRLTGHDPEVELLIVSTAFDMSGDAPFVWPAKGADEDLAMIRVRQGATHHWTIGNGSPVFPPKELVRGLMVSMLVSESCKEVRSVAETIATINDALSKGKAAAAIAALATAAGGPGAALGVAALGEITGVVAGILKADKDVVIGAYAGILSATIPWTDDQLEQDDNGASIKLSVVH